MVKRISPDDIRRIGAVTTTAFDDARMLEVVAMTDPDPNWPESCRVLLSLDYKPPGEDGQPMEVSFGLSPYMARTLVAMMNRAADAAEMAMFRGEVAEKAGEGGDTKGLLHAKRELAKAGLTGPDAEYGGMIAEAVLGLVEIFSRQGHSGFSAMKTLMIFERLAKFKVLTPLTDDPEEWQDVSAEAGRPSWQSRRQSSCFSDDGGKTYYDLSDLREKGTPRPMHTSAPAQVPR